jgi:hypothetical protein
MKRILATFWTVLILSVLGLSQTQFEIEPLKELKPTGTLGTCHYRPTAAESAFFSKLAAGERTTGSIVEDYDIQQKAGYVSWYGIVRGISGVKDASWRLLMEHKFFDGSTDCHIMLVDISGSGDFCSDVEAVELPVPALALARVYGTITGQDGGKPVIKAVYVRVWPWRTFTFMRLVVNDRTNQKWKDTRSISREQIYQPYPDDRYYRAVLGDPAEYGLSFKGK